MKRFISIFLCMALICGLSFAGYKFVSFDVSLDSGKNGTLTAEKLSARPFETVKVHIKPSRNDGYYVLEKLVVNGVDYTDEVKLDTITLKWIHEDLDIKATFKKANPPVAEPIFV